VKWHSAFLAPFPTFSAVYWLFCTFCSTGKVMYQFKKVDRYFRWGIRSFLAGGKKKLEKSSAVLLMQTRTGDKILALLELCILGASECHFP
jgi:hypothetical protein